MAANIQSMIASVAGQTGIDSATAETAVGTVLSILQHEAPAAQVSELFGAIGGASVLAAQYDVMQAPTQGGGGLFGAIEGAIGGALGDKVGALIKGVEQLQGTGLTVTQIEQAGQALIAEAKGSLGGTLMEDLVGAVPGLGGHLGV